MHVLTDTFTENTDNSLCVYISATPLVTLKRASCTLLNANLEQVITLQLFYAKLDQ
jgi:hypothetical protein